MCLREIWTVFICVLFIDSPTIAIGGFTHNSRSIISEQKVHRRDLPSFMSSIAATFRQKKWKTTMDNALLNILDSCLLGDSRETFLLAGEFEGFLRTHRKYLEDKNIALMGDPEYTASKNSIVAKHSARLDHNLLQLFHKLRVFVVFASSSPVFQRTLRWISESNWANAEGFYIFYDTAEKKNDCWRAYHFLWASWEFDHTSAVYLCGDNAGEVLLYTYNPYYNIMPAQWVEVRQYEGRGGHPWTLLRRNYNSVDLSCQDLYFDKTANLGGYEVRMNAAEVPPFVTISGNTSSLEDFTGENSKTLRALWAKLNVTPSVTVYEEIQSIAFGDTDDNGKPTGMFANIANGKSDMTMNFRYLTPKWNVRFTYPHAEGGLCVITQNTGYMSELTKLLDFLSAELVICIVAVKLATLLILSCVGRRGFSSAGLNTLRLFVCVSMILPPTSSIARIYLYTVIFMLMTINAIFQSHWSSILTLPVANPNVDDIDDLEHSEHTIYGSGVLRDVITDSSLLQRFRPIKYSDCKAAVLKDVKAACLTDCRHALYRIGPDNLHHSSIIHKFLESYVTRANWPLYERVNRMIQNMVETGLVYRWRRKDLRPYRWYNRRQQLVKGRGFRVLRIDRLTFIFYFLVAGLLCSLVIFLFEVLVGRHRIRPINAKMIKNEKKDNRRVMVKPVRYIEKRKDFPWLS